MKNFMCNVNVVSDIPPSNESILKRGDEGVHKRLKCIKSLEMILYITLQRLMGLKWLTLSGKEFFGMRVM